MFLHLYHNDLDNKEHLAIVFGNSIRSRSLDAIRPGETEMDRMIRGAYIGTLRPGRVSSWYDSSTNTESASSGQERSTSGAPASSQTPELAQSNTNQAPLVRIHSECYTGETAWSARCDCGEQLDEAARLMSLPMETLNEVASQQDLSVPSNASGGVIIYLRQEGRGIGLGEKLKAYNLQDLGSDTVEANLLLRHPADARSYGLATAMLADLGLGVDSNPHGIRLLTNNPDKIRAVEGPNREVVVKERVPMVPLAWRTGGKMGITSSEVEGYLRTKVGFLTNDSDVRNANVANNTTDLEDGPHAPINHPIPAFSCFYVLHDFPDEFYVEVLSLRCFPAFCCIKGLFYDCLSYLRCCMSLIFGFLYTIICLVSRGTTSWGIMIYY